MYGLTNIMTYSEGGKFHAEHAAHACGIDFPMFPLVKLKPFEKWKQYSIQCIFCVPGMCTPHFTATSHTFFILPFLLQLFQIRPPKKTLALILVRRCTGYACMYRGIRLSTQQDICRSVFSDTKFFCAVAIDTKQRDQLIARDSASYSPRYFAGNKSFRYSPCVWFVLINIFGRWIVCLTLHSTVLCNSNVVLQEANCLYREPTFGQNVLDAT